MIAISMAFLLGLVGALSLRSTTPIQNKITAVEAPQIKWRTPVAFGTHLPALGDNILYVSEQLSRASGGRVLLDVYEPACWSQPLVLPRA